jgi:hypothetical protein
MNISPKKSYIKYTYNSRFVKRYVDNTIRDTGNSLYTPILPVKERSVTKPMRETPIKSFHTAPDYCPRQAGSSVFPVLA